MPRRSNSFTVRNPKKSALVSDTNLQKLSTYSRRSLRHSKRGRTVNKGNSQSHDTVTKIDIVFPRVERQLSKRNHETRLIPGMGVVRPTPSLPPVSTAKKFFTDFVFPDTKVKSVHMQLDKNIIGKDTKQTNHNGIKKTELMPVETNGSVKLDQVKQKLQDVLAITDENVRKDGMKKLVKSIVSDGGITIESGTVDGISDISTLENIMGLITDISANLKHNSNASTTMDLSIQNVMPKLPKHDSSDITRVSKIGSLQDVPNIIVKGSSQIMDSDKTHIVSPKSSQSLKHLAGMSIFGDTGLPVTNTRSLQEGQGTYSLTVYQRYILHTLKHIATMFILQNSMRTSSSENV